VSQTGSRKWIAFVFIWLLLLGGAAVAYKWFFAAPDEIEVPFILWGGDVATFHANGGLDTKEGTIFAKQGLKVKLVRGDDFDKQVKSYKEGRSPFLRGTMSMLAQATEDIGKEPGMRPVVFLQLTWSAGDHLVSRSGLKLLADIKNKKIALQKGGPHVGMLNDILRTAQLTWKDITPVWTEDVSGDKGPAELFRKESSVDACFAITPDMEDLTGGLDKVGTGSSPKSVQGAHVLISTAHMKRSIADVYACRKDFFDKHKDLVEKFAAGYLKACEELVAMRKEYQKAGSSKYASLLRMTQEIYGKNDIADEKVADGLIGDAAFVGLPGNKSFFTAAGNLSGFKAKLKAALEIAVQLNGAKGEQEFPPADLDYDKLAKLGELTGKAPSSGQFRDDVKSLGTIYSFTINFAPGQTDFPAKDYGAAFQRALEQASLFGNAVMVLRGHTDAFGVLNAFKQQGLASGQLRKKEGDGPYDYVLGGTTFDLRDVRKVTELLKHADFADKKLKEAPQRLTDLSFQRADGVRTAVLKFAADEDYQLDKSQIKIEGVGFAEPVEPIRDPESKEEAAKHRRVEFRLIKVTEGSMKKTGDFDY
jgi:ABC-type nitrate/sulfonate/bicarbonate transport system substrate-binding protein/outer membrane protein OmpA-like peptidoglycan-associated protein